MAFSVSRLEPTVDALLKMGATPPLSKRCDRAVRQMRHRLVKCVLTTPSLDLPGKSGDHQLRNQEVAYGKREQTEAGVSA